MNNIVKFLDRNWINTASNVLLRHCYPGYFRVDIKNVTALNTEYGSFYYNKALQNFPDVFEQIEEYDISDFSKDDVVLDIGANLGVFTVKVAPLVKHVIAVEPLFFDELRANVELNNLKNVACLPYALGPERMIDISFCGKSKQVKCIELKNLCEYNYDEVPNVLKIDCEGGEWSVPPEEFADYFDRIEGEFHNFDCEGHRQDPEKYLDSLKAVGYDCKYEYSGKQLMIHARK